MSDEASPPTAQDRRAFLATLGGAAIAASGLGAIACAMNPSTSGAAGTAATTSPAIAGGSSLGPIGVQLYTVRDEMQKDVAATLARVARIGYKEVEFAGYFGHSPTEIRGMLDANGLTAPSSHIPLQMMQADPAGVAATAKAIGHEYVVVPFLDPSQRNDWHGLAKSLNSIGAEMAKQGLKLGYHNHNFEFASTGSGPLPYEILVGETDPALVKLEMDLYWATMAGQDPVAWFAKQPGRFELVHVKDSRGGADNAMAPVGSGTIDWKRIFAKRAQAGIRHFFVEHDNAAEGVGGSFASIESSFNYLNAFRG
ncbi:MAG: TIM barrel protein [Gemmatimonadaceae bacterium]